MQFRSTITHWHLQCRYPKVLFWKGSTHHGDSKRLQAQNWSRQQYGRRTKIIPDCKIVYCRNSHDRKISTGSLLPVNLYDIEFGLLTVRPLSHISLTWTFTILDAFMTKLIDSDFMGSSWSIRVAMYSWPFALVINYKLLCKYCVYKYLVVGRRAPVLQISVQILRGAL